MIADDPFAGAFGGGPTDDMGRLARNAARAGFAVVPIEPMAEWEAGRAAPTWEQLLALADLTEFSVLWFVAPKGRPARQLAGDMIACGSGGCEVLTGVDAVSPYDPSVPLARVINLFGQQSLR